VVFTDPFGTAGLDFFNKISQAGGRMEISKDMHMVFHAVDAIEMPVQTLNNAPDVPVQVISLFDFENHRAIFGCEYNVIDDLGVC
jgi:hypothetical protein